MVRWRVADLLKQRGWSAYKLVQAAGISPTVVYRLAKSKQQVKRVDGRTLNALCAALGVGPGELLEHIPDKPAGQRAKRRA